jgi:hypothetical protein
MGGYNLMDKFKRLFKKDEQNEIDEKYIFVPDNEIIMQIQLSCGITLVGTLKVLEHYISYQKMI